VLNREELVWQKLHTHGCGLYSSSSFATNLLVDLGKNLLPPLGLICQMRTLEKVVLFRSVAPGVEGKMA
jgi:hypothetical protein